MMTESDSNLLSTKQIAEFVASGYLRFDGIAPQEINEQFLADIGYVDENEIIDVREYYGRLMTTSSIPAVAAGTPLYDAYPKDGAITKLLNHVRVAGIIRSLVGSNPTFDHHFLHVTFPPKYYATMDQEQASQHTHQDSTIDVREAFDIQIMYFPHEVTLDMGGTRYVPGSHLRVVSNSAIGRYQNIKGQEHVVCPAGSLLVLHMGIWHGGGLNRSDSPRYMFKIRMCPSGRQSRLWNTSDLTNDYGAQRAIFWPDVNAPRDSLHATLMRAEPWFEHDTMRLEMMNRIRLMRYLLDDPSFDVDYWMTRVENDFVS